MPGTTRDAIEVEFDSGDHKYTLIDTAGLRRRGKVFEAVEKFSVVKTLQAISDANVVILMLDARQDISDQDAHIAGFVVEQGRAVVLAVNKWDGLDEDRRDEIKRDLARKLTFMGFAKLHFISALQHRGIGALMSSVRAAHEAAFRKLPTPKLTRVLAEAVQHQAPPRHGVSRPKPRYAHQGGMNPPIVIIHGSGLQHVPPHYTRFWRTGSVPSSIWRGRRYASNTGPRPIRMPSRRAEIRAEGVPSVAARFRFGVMFRRAVPQECLKSWSSP